MKKILLSILTISAMLLATENTKSEDITKAELKKAMEKEKKYAKEQKFYTEKNYDFKGAEVNEKSLKSLDKIEMDYDLDSEDILGMD